MNKRILEFPNAVIGGVNDPTDWGGCPKCHRNDGFLNADDGMGMGQWFYCKRHKLKWHIGTNLLSAWLHMPEKELTRQGYMLADCAEVKPWYPPKKRPWAGNLNPRA